MTQLSHIIEITIQKFQMDLIRSILLISSDILQNSSFIMTTERNDKRLQVITLYQHTTKTHEEIVLEVGVNQSTVSRIIKRFEESGDYKTRYENCGGQNKKFGERDLRHLRKLAVKSPRSTAADIHEAMGESAADVSLRTIQRALNEAGCSVRTPQQKPYLSPSNVEKRFKWAQEHAQWTVKEWKNVLWSDETIIEANDGCPRFVRVVDGFPLTDQHCKTSV